MASLFTPESERLRAGAARTEGGRAPAGSVRIPGMKDIKGHKSGDSLGNPNSPGYEPWGKKKERAPEAASPGEEAKGPAGTVIETSVQGPELIRLSVGWDKILLAQRKICEKAKGLFTLLEGPEKYRTQKKNRLPKSRGCIVDLDIQETAEELAEKLKEAKARENKEPA